MRNVWQNKISNVSLKANIDGQMDGQMDRQMERQKKQLVGARAFALPQKYKIQTTSTILKHELRNLI